MLTFSVGRENSTIRFDLSILELENEKIGPSSIDELCTYRVRSLLPYKLFLANILSWYGTYILVEYMTQFYRRSFINQKTKVLHIKLQIFYWDDAWFSLEQRFQNNKTSRTTI